MDTIFYPVKILADWITFSLLSIQKETLLSQAVNFFIYDTVKIFILLAVIIFAVSIIRTFLPTEKVRKLLAHKYKFTGNIMAALIGILTPFCTCSAIPLFLGFLKAGVPLGVTFSFLIASPMINEVAVILLLGMFGWKIALLYIASGLVIAVVAGILISKLNVDNLIIDMDYKKDMLAKQDGVTWNDRINYGRRYTRNIIRKVWPYVVGGIAVGAFIHGYVPTDFLAQYAGSDKWYAVPFAVLAGIPLYSNAAGIVPLVSVLTEKGVAMGTVLAFMMAVTALSLPEFMILKRVMKTKLIVIFAAIVGTGILITGYIFNIVIK
ncbi:MAG: permease [Patescibacteria group bacterium]